MSTHPINNKITIFLALIALLAVAPTASAQVINEWVADHTGSTDTFEYVEIFGAPSTDYSNLSILHIEADSNTTTGTIGRIDVVYPVGTTNGLGYWTTGFLTNELENGSMALLLVSDFTGAIGDDIDADNDGTRDTAFWTTLIDDIAITDGDAGDGVYSTTHLYPNFDGFNTYPPGGGSRIPNGTDTDAMADWRRNDYSGCGLPGLTGYLEAWEACNTPGEENSMRPKYPVLNEFVAGHVGGTDDHEYVEIYGGVLSYYANSCIVVVVGDYPSTGVVDQAIQAGWSDKSGYWSTGFLTNAFEDGSYTIVLASWANCGSAVGSDLDGDDDGSFDSPPWDYILDSVSVDDGGAGDIAYSATVLDANFDGAGSVVAGASRMPDSNNDPEGPWMRNDFDGAGLDGFAGTLVAGEAYNTPGWRNLVGLDDYYAGIDHSSDLALRGSVHEAIDDHRRFGYTEDHTDTWDILDEADEDPNDPTKIIDVYRNASIDDNGGGGGGYDREHTWPQSYGIPNDSYDNMPYTDCHHLRLADSTYNGYRSNQPFRTCDPDVNPSCVERATVFNNGTGGSPGTGHPGFSNWDADGFDNGSWETWIGRRGDVARSLLYLDVRYAGGHHGATGVTEPDLILTDSQALISASVTGSNEPIAYMGFLSDLLLWHEQDPVDDDEQQRNEVVYSYQGNRNPFVDHPEWVQCIFENQGCAALFVDGFESGDTSAWTAAVP